MRPVSLYGRSKVAAEHMLLQRENSISLRLATVFGMSPRMRMDLLLNDFVYRAVTDRAVTVFEGHAKRNYIHIRDIAHAFIDTLSKFAEMRGWPYNVGLSNANLSKLELCQKIRRWVPNFHYHEAAIGEDPDKRDYLVSNARMEATGWKPFYVIGRRNRGADEGLPDDPKLGLWERLMDAVQHSDGTRITVHDDEPQKGDKCDVQGCIRNNRRNNGVGRWTMVRALR